MSDLVSLRAGALRAAIHPLGAELQSFRPTPQTEWLWHGDPTWWEGRAPLLFPVIGRSPGGRVHWRGTSFEMPPHGLARQSRFRPTQSDDHRARFEFSDDAMTRQHYPFAFRVVVEYRLDETGLTMRVQVDNPARDTVLPANLGFHPAFVWPLVPGAGKTAHAVVFEHEEPAPIQSLTEDGLTAVTRRATPVRGRVLALNDALFEDRALVFERHTSRRVWYGVPGKPGLRVEFSDCPHLGIWTKPGAPFVCIEPWQGYAADVGGDGDLAQRPGVVLLPPGGSFSRTLVLAPDVVPAA